MIYELFLEGELADIRQDLGMQLNFNIDDINKYGSRDTSFSKTIVLPGTAKNNKLLGFVGELGSFNTYAGGAANIGSNFNPAQTTKAELRANGLLLLKGVFRLTGIVKDRDIIEYEGNLFGELGGFIAEIGRGKLEELDFNAYNHTYTYNNIVNSWNTVNGSGYYYPLIDYGTYSDQKVDYDYRTFRPALYVKEYIDKIFALSGYTYESSFLNTNFFKKLIIPGNAKELKGLFSDLLYVQSQISRGFFDIVETRVTIDFPYEYLKRSFTGNGDPNFTYTGSNTTLNLKYRITAIGIYAIFYPACFVDVFVYKNNEVIRHHQYDNGNNDQDEVPFSIIIQEDFNISANTNDTFRFEFFYDGVYGNNISTFTIEYFQVNSINPIVTDALLNQDILIKDSVPKNILQKDFFTWIVKMFNLYVTEDKVKEKHLLIEPYVDYYDLTEYVDWTYKVARDKPWQIKPMGMLASRFYEYKYKDDTDFYNEGYKKKYNQPYGTSLEDTRFQFAKDKQTLEVGFSPSVLVEYLNRDKVVSALYKKSKGGSVDQEERMDTNIRIMMAKKITGVGSWNIVNTGTPIGASLTAYGYAGHFDDPKNPTVDINFGAAAEIYFDPLTYPSANLFNEYWSGYIAEIADKDSKLLTCHVYLTDLDIAQLDFSKPVFIDGVLWRINKIMDFDASSGELTKVELLKIIDTSYPCARNWTKTNYTGTTFRNGDIIPQVTDQTAWANLTTPAWCCYNNDPANDAIYGKLYNWYAINDPRGFAPEGYRFPTDADWTGLTDCLGGESVAGGKMKSITGWASPNTDATNESGFSGLPGGLRDPSGSFNGTTFDGYWWSSTDGDANNAWARYLNFSFGDVIRQFSDKNYGYSVRLIKE